MRAYLAALMLAGMTLVVVAPNAAADCSPDGIGANCSVPPAGECEVHAAEGGRLVPMASCSHVGPPVCICQIPDL